MFGEKYHLPQLKRWNKPLSFFINLLCHVLILLTFLTIFFFKYIAGLTESHIDAEMKSLVQQQTDQLMAYLDQQDTQNLIQWNIVNNVATALIDESSKNVTFITKNNTELYNDSMCTLLMFLFGIVLIVGYLIFRGVDLQLKFIFMENFVIFAFVGMIEIYFFMNIASKYIPVLPDDAVKAVFSRLNYNMAQH
jgi:hypothetical protein